MAFDEACFSEKEMHVVELFKNNLGLGITVAGYVCDEEEISGVFVKDVCIGSAAHLEGKIRKNDRIIKVNDKSLTDLTNQEAIELLKNSGDAVSLTIERYLERSTYKRLSHSIRSQTLPSISSQVFGRSSRKRVSNCKSEVNLDVLPEYDPVSSANLKLDKNSMPISPLCKDCDLSLKASLNQNSNNIKKVKEEKLPTDLTIKQNRTTASNILLPNSYNIGMVDANNEISQIIPKSDISANSDSIYFSKTSDDTEKDDTEKDGYETCMDESLSEEGLVKNKVMESSCDVIQSEVIRAINVSSGNMDLPGECSVNNKNDNFLTTSDEHLEYNRNLNNNLEIYNDPNDMTDADEFFLVEYVNNSVPEHDVNFLTESEVPYAYEVQTSVTYKCIKLHEYYNDFEDCIEEYKTYLNNSSKKASNTLSNCDESYSCNQSLNTLTTEDDILIQSNFLFKCNSDPQLYHFEKLELSDINSNKRRSSYLDYYKDSLEGNNAEMTVTSKQQSFNIKSQQNSSSTNLKKYWTSLKNIQVHRNSTEKLGISIVCGKVDFHTPYNESWETTSGIFVKSILPNSAAGNTEQFQIGDRILEVNGIALTDIGHEEAASIIRSATNPITFVVQSLVPPFQNELVEDSPDIKIEPYNLIEQNNKFNEQIKTATVENNIDEKLDSPKECISLDEPDTKTDPIAIIISEEAPPSDKGLIEETSPSGADICKEEPLPAKIISEKETPQASDTFPKEEALSQSDAQIKQETIPATVPKKVEDDDEEEDEEDDFEDERELEGRIITKKGQQIDRSSAGNVRRTTEEIAADTEEEDEFGYTSGE